MKTFFTILFLLTINITLAQITHTIDWESDVGLDATMTIDVGDTVEWINVEEGMPHDVTSNDSNAPEGFGSEILGYMEAYSFTFNSPVVFDYGCSIHPGLMDGTITVEAVMSVGDNFAETIQYMPNPVQDYLYVSSPTTLKSISVINIQGQQIISELLPQQNTSYDINLQTLKSGVYFVRVTGVEGQRALFKILKK